MAGERFDANGWHRLAVGLRAGDPDGQVTAAWQLKELVRGLFGADDVDQAREVFVLIDAWAATVEAPECRRLVRTLHRWQDEILAYHTTGQHHQRADRLPTQSAAAMIACDVVGSGRGSRPAGRCQSRPRKHPGMWRPGQSVGLHTQGQMEDDEREHADDGDG
jgi:hypothetical protein